ncbi:glycosyltransferase [Actinokineospora diospyrosa]|uniref:Glycosyltransferase involved in cell wall bisynthesis n=1 Tax=Actinokineospora diospyrosa TaxID=103728 RepID=A0ABT1I5L3_9PSEU|nr:glycosyltransferase [Actinokineospora diospyrosa]MCP2267902.1 Glycosyltransferase involved in cell wall bisynthesis [Actinokineospora diospyrosa]
MSNNDDILVLTTREKDWWWSMQEIFPAIERVWTGIARRERERVRVLCAPLLPGIRQDVEALAARVKMIVLATVTPGTVEIALHLRSRLAVDAPMIVYVHGDSTEGFHAFGALPDLLTERDVFVVASGSEAAATRLCFPNARISVIPFPLVDQFKVSGAERGTKFKTARLAYVGRVAEQKNLHTLLFAMWILRTAHDSAPRITLDVFGGEANPGSPMMGFEYPDYGGYLRELAESLGLADAVTWHGTKPRDWLFYNVHSEPYIFVHPTLLSDENFGSSVLASLVNGHQVVTTEWGGPRGWQEWFPHLTLVPVRRSTRGPVVDPGTLANAILTATDRMATLAVDDATLDRARTEFSERAAVTRAAELLDSPLGDPVPLRKSPVLQHLDKQRVRFGSERKIYADYDDPTAQLFFEAYGMKNPLAFEDGASYVLAPWVSYSDQVLRIDDPHRGQQSFTIDPEIPEPVDVTLCPSTDTCTLPKSLVEKLVAQGYAFHLRRPVVINDLG